MSDNPITKDECAAMVRESQLALNNEINRRFSSLEYRLSNVESDVAKINNNMADVKSDVAKINNNMAVVESNVAKTNNNIADVKQILLGIQKKLG